MRRENREREAGVMAVPSAEKFYAMLRSAAVAGLRILDEVPVIRIGTATCGIAAGALLVRDTFRDELNKRGIEARVMEVGCMGHCYAEPMVIITKPGFPSLCYNNVDEELAIHLVDDFLARGDPCYEFAMAALEPNDFFPTFQDFPRGIYEEKMILGDCGLIDPQEIDHFLARDGYLALCKALQTESNQVLQEIKKANLRGRGGAGFPAGEKWDMARKAPGEIKFVICNGDEGDPGAFMDRNILESNPHLVIEGMIICAYCVGASRGFLYIRSEYRQAVCRMERALEQAREKGLLGERILGSNFSFDLEIFTAAGAFVCGEGTALVKSMEGKMGIPEHRPPELAESGYLGKPTVLNNVKTFCYVPPIILRGARWFRDVGTPESPGTAVFALAGKISAPGLVEVPMGTTLRQLIDDVGGGVPHGKRFKAVQIGGPSGGCLPEQALDIPIDFDSLLGAGAMMGSGGIIVLDEDDCMVRIARFFLNFTQEESCGKCTFCRLGTRHMFRILDDIIRGKGEMGQLETLRRLAEDIKIGSLCNLGKTAPNPVLTTLRYFFDEYRAHISEKRCPALSCPELTVYFIEPKRCSKLCNVCIGSCPVEAIFTRDDGLKAIDQEKCVKCDNCLKACPPDYSAVIKLSPLSLLDERLGKNK